MVSTIHDHTDPPNSQALYLSVIADVTGYPETDADDPGLLPADAQVRLQHIGGSPTIRCYKELASPGSDDWQFEDISLSKFYKLDILVACNDLPSLTPAFRQ